MVPVPLVLLVVVGALVVLVVLGALVVFEVVVSLQATNTNIDAVKIKNARSFLTIFTLQKNITRVSLDKNKS
jgi:hypothetical protein